LALLFLTGADAAVSSCHLQGLRFGWYHPGRHHCRRLHSHCRHHRRLYHSHCRHHRRHLHLHPHHHYLLHRRPLHLLHRPHHGLHLCHPHRPCLPCPCRCSASH
ncbi:unnamed protein product, partial [Closterium sp. NIES-53]